MDYDKERNVEQEPEVTPSEESQEVPQAPTPPEPSLVAPQVSEKVIQNLQSERQRYKNIADTLQSEIAVYQEHLAQLQSEQRRTLLAELGDNPTVQDLVKKLEQSELAAAKLTARERKVVHLEKMSDAQELSEKYGCTTDELMDAQSFAEMEGMAKTLGRLKTASPPETPKKPPAIPHIPDSGVTSARPRTDFETLEQGYAEGKISFTEYREARKKKGLF